MCGTGAIVVGRDHEGSYLFAGGWGWVLSDDASAPGLVREATRAALSAHDAGRPDDGLLSALQDAFDARRPDLLARAVNDAPTPGNWGPKAPVVFAAADAGSALAARVIEAGAAHLATLVELRSTVARSVATSWPAAASSRTSPACTRTFSACSRVPARRWPCTCWPVRPSTARSRPPAAS